jgi:hypothetical protein
MTHWHPTWAKQYQAQHWTRLFSVDGVGGRTNVHVEEAPVLEPAVNVQAVVLDTLVLGSRGLRQAHNSAILDARHPWYHVNSRTAAFGQTYTMRDSLWHD